MDGDFCPDCGAGIIEHGDGYLVCRVHKDYPFEKPCGTCERRNRERLAEFGREMAASREAAILKTVCGE